jgi:cytochrome c peroxidase
VALTAPYFHDGTQATLKDAVIAMAKYEVGVDLSKQEVAQMVSFLRTLTGEYQGKLLVNENDLQK